MDTGTQNANGFTLPRRNGRLHRRRAEIIVPGTTSNQPWDIDLDPRTTTYAEWTARFFRRDAAANVTDPNADPDNDRLSNFGEYAFDSAPLGAQSTARVTYFTVQEGQTRYPAVRYFRRASATDLIYTVEISTDLVACSVNGTLEVSTGLVDVDGMQHVITRSLVPIDAAPRQFFRVRAASIGIGRASTTVGP